MATKRKHTPLDECELLAKLLQDKQAMNEFIEKYPNGRQQAKALGVCRNKWFKERKKFGIGCFEFGTHPHTLKNLAKCRQRYAEVHRKDHPVKQHGFLSVEEYHRRFGDTSNRVDVKTSG